MNSTNKWLCLYICLLCCVSPKISRPITGQEGYIFQIIRSLGDILGSTKSLTASEPTWMSSTHSTVRHFSFDISYFDTNLFISYDILYKGGQFYSGLSEWTSFNYPYWILLNMIFEANLVGKIFSIAWHLMGKYPLYPFVAWHFRIQIQNGGGGKNAFALKITVTFGGCLYSTPLGHRYRALFQKMSHLA